MRYISDIVYILDLIVLSLVNNTKLSDVSYRYICKI